MSSRRFHKYVYKFEVLSEEPLGPMSLVELHYETHEGHCSGQFLDTEYEELDGLQAAKALVEQGSDPEFFGLDPDGEDMEEE